MKDFIKMVGATMVGLILLSIVSFFFIIIGAVGILASSEEGTQVAGESILHIKLQGEVTERAKDDFMATLNGEQTSVALDEVLKAIGNAANNDKIKGIYLEGGAIAGDPAMLQEIRQALERFKESKKWIVAYADNYTQGSYYVCTAANELYMNPYGMLDWHGLGSEAIFFTDVMKKLGVKMQVYKVGSFKSAVEPFINTEMSEPNREQVASYLSSIWNNMLADVSSARGLTTDRLHNLADSMQTFADPSSLVEAKMVDKLMYKDEMRSLLKSKMGIAGDKKLCFVTPKELADEKKGINISTDQIAVYYAYGNIVDDATGGLMGGTEAEIAPAPMNTELDKLANDDKVKAVIIRVNSGGGSAYASEQIWRQVTLLKEKKPVVISMGGMAASGGYYISAGASHIVAEPTTLTGSIGIFGMVPDVSELMTEKIGLHYDVVKTNRYADFGTMSRPMNDEEGKMMQTYVERGYDLFTKRVAMGRGISQDSVKSIAEGRVWTGEQAKQLGLVDELGDLQTAIKAAARLAGIEEYITADYPAQKTLLEEIMSEQNLGDEYMQAQTRSALGEYSELFYCIRNIDRMNRIQARLPYIIKIHN